MEFKKLLVRSYRENAGVSLHMVRRLTDDLTPDELNWQAAPGHHSIWHNLWHMYLSNDYYASNALDLPAVWDEQCWSDRIDLAPMARAFEFSGNAAGGPVPRFVIADVPDSVVDELKAPPLAQYVAYAEDMLTRTQARLEAAPEEQLRAHIEQYGRRPRVYDIVTGFAHVYRHIGMMEDVRGLIRGPGTGTASL